VIAHYLLLVLLDLALLAGWFAIPLGLGGNFILLGLALLVAVATHFTAIGWGAIGILAGAVAMGEAIEAFLGAVMARRFGASRYGMAGSLAGGIIGAMIGTAILPLIGSLIGSFLGSALGAITGELARGTSRARGLRAGWGAFLGKALAVAVKLSIGAAIIVFVIARTH
jgi:uncharacterized protein